MSTRQTTDVRQLCLLLSSQWSKVWDDGLVCVHSVVRCRPTKPIRRARPGAASHACCSSFVSVLPSDYGCWPMFVCPSQVGSAAIQHGYGSHELASIEVITPGWLVRDSLSRWIQTAPRSHMWCGKMGLDPLWMTALAWGGAACVSHAIVYSLRWSTLVRRARLGILVEGVAASRPASRSECLHWLYEADIHGTVALWTWIIDLSRTVHHLSTSCMSLAAPLD